MKSNVAAGLLMCRLSGGQLEYFLVHPGGPFFLRKDIGAWSIPKGIPEEGENLMDTAQREFFEETGLKPIPPFISIEHIKQKGGKVVHAWAFLGSWDSQAGIKCNTFTMEWPPRSGNQAEFPEVDKAQWANYTEASRLIRPEQIPFLDRAQKIFDEEKNHLPSA